MPVQSRKIGSSCALGLFIGFQDYIISCVKRVSGLHFVHCIRPLSVAGAHMHPDELLDLHYVRNQLCSISLVNSARALNQGVHLLNVLIE
ncbi:unnamed protein product [Gongylonema pulchrum]|uniref:Secreted protein n=1 Tax=Gongylonema pulchrum TaxID=637853 RepID=A0A183EBS6_9BILA|nr:unnamed protein product [Gongylonema pulchrum]